MNGMHIQTDQSETYRDRNACRQRQSATYSERHRQILADSNRDREPGVHTSDQRHTYIRTGIHIRIRIHVYIHTYTQRHMHTDRQTYGHPHGLAVRQTDTETDSKTEANQHKFRHSATYIGRQTQNSQTYRRKYINTDIQTNKQQHTERDIHTYIQRDSLHQTARQRDRRSDIHIQ